MPLDEGTERRALAHINRARELEYQAQQERDERRRRDMLELAAAYRRAVTSPNARFVEAAHDLIAHLKTLQAD